MNWLEEQAKKILKEKITKYSKTIQVNPSKLVIKNLKNRWDSITQNDTINLNVNLLKAPEDVIDYIIIHEFSSETTMVLYLILCICCITHKL